MHYTKPLTYKQLVNRLFKVADEIGAKLYEDNRVSCDGKVVVRLVLKTSRCEVEFYDYKATKLYSDSLPTVAKHKRSKYEYHVQGNEFLMTELILNKVNK